MRPIVLITFIAACTGATSDEGTTDDGTTPHDCEKIRAAWQTTYDALVAENTCSEPEDCHAPYGACPTQLGGCQEPVSTTVTQEELAAVESGYIAEAEAEGCDPIGAVCDCYGGYGADCDAGTCVLTGPTYE